MTSAAKLWYLAAAAWALAFIIAVVTTNLILLVGLDIVMVILCLVMADEA